MLTAVTAEIHGDAEGRQKPEFYETASGEKVQDVLLSKLGGTRTRTGWADGDERTDRRRSAGGQLGRLRRARGRGWSQSHDWQGRRGAADGPRAERSWPGTDVSGDMDGTGVRREGSAGSRSAKQSGDREPRRRGAGRSARSGPRARPPWGSAPSHLTVPVAVPVAVPGDLRPAGLEHSGSRPEPARPCLRLLLRREG